MTSCAVMMALKAADRALRLQALQPVVRNRRPDRFKGNAEPSLEELLDDPILHHLLRSRVGRVRRGDSVESRT